MSLNTDIVVHNIAQYLEIPELRAMCEINRELFEYVLANIRSLAARHRQNPTIALWMWARDSRRFGMAIFSHVAPWTVFTYADNIFSEEQFMVGLELYYRMHGNAGITMVVDTLYNRNYDHGDDITVDRAYVRTLRRQFHGQLIALCRAAGNRADGVRLARSLLEH